MFVVEENNKMQKGADNQWENNKAANLLFKILKWNDFILKMGQNYKIWSLQPPHFSLTNLTQIK